MKKKVYTLFLKLYCLFSFVNNVVNGNSKDNYVHEHNVFPLIKYACCLICFQIAIPSAMLCVRIAYGICIKSDFGSGDCMAASQRLGRDGRGRGVAPHGMGLILSGTQHDGQGD
jgi:hypothetical protein